MSKKINKLKNYIFVVITILTLIFSTSVISQAASIGSLDSLMSGPNIGNTISIGWNWGGATQLAKNSYLYCVQHQRTMRLNTYVVSNYIKIEGNTATSSDGRTVTHLNNGVLAYILGGGDYEKGYGKGQFDLTIRQKALWKYFNTWISTVGSNLGVSWADYNNTTVVNSTAVNTLITEAQNYASQNNMNAQIKNLGPETLTTSSSYAGPFKVSYTGNISSIAVKDSNGSDISEVKFYTDKNGQTEVQPKDIKSEQEFYIKNTSGRKIQDVKVNVTAKGTIVAKMWLLKNNSSSLQRLMSVKTSTKTTDASVTIKVKSLGSLNISKIDAETNQKLNAGFKVKTSKGWLNGSNGKYTYNASFESATKYNTTNGICTLADLEFGKYEIYEVEAPEGYDLSKQTGYDKNNKWVKAGTVTISAKNENVTVTHSNAKKISISGYVWIDEPRTKAAIYDNLYNDDTPEQRVQNVIVRLVNKNNPNNAISTITNSNGQYMFEKAIIRSELKNYYIEFNYSGTNYKSYIPVAFNSANKDEIKAEGSRALADSIPAKDSDLTGIAKTYTGSNSDKETIYGLSGNLNEKLYNSNNVALENINLGIKQLKEPTYRIDQNLSYVKIVMKGYTYTYNYGQQGDNNYPTVPQVNWQSKGAIDAYTRAIYPSDIAYDIKNSTEELKVYVGYEIVITNTTTYDIEDLYVEQKMYVENVIDKFDTNRYELHDDNWTVNGDTAIIKPEYLKQVYGDGIEKNANKTSNIEFSVKHDAILDILNHPEGIIEEFPTKAMSLAYHEYKRKDYSWANDVIAEQTHYTTSTQQEDDAPYLIFKLGNERVISGKVFEDKIVSTNGEKLGNGIFEDSENAAKGVKVELLDVNNETDDIRKLTTSTLYRVNKKDDGTIEAITIPATTETDTQGNYNLAGIVPGYYYLRFTYGDGSQKICDSEGNEIAQITGKQYKSTIITSNVAKNALGYSENEYKELWYKYLEGTNYSVAVDNLDSRKEYNSKNEGNLAAGTAKISITIENTGEDSSTVVTGEEQYNTFGGFNLGIAKQPEQSIKIEKIITNVRLVNAQNNILMDGNPETASLKGVSDLDGITNGGSTYTRIELEEEQIYGSTLTLTYAIKVTNISDVNYYSDKYYWFGDKTGAYEVTLQIEEVIDYLDSKLQYVPEASEERVQVIESEAEETLLAITGWNVLYTEKNAERTESKKTSDEITLTAQKVLANDDNDMEFINKVNVTKLTNSTDPDDTDSNKLEKLKIVVNAEIPTEEASAKATITPPTGFDLLTITIYLVAGVALLAGLSAGIIAIKKKVL